MVDLKKTHPIIKRFLKFKNTAVERVAWPYIFEQNPFAYWRAHVLFAILSSALVLGSFALVSAIALVIKEGAWGLALFDVTGFVICLALIFVPRITYELRTFLVLLMTYATGIAVIISVGPLSGGPAWLFAFAVLTGVFLGARPALIAIVLNAISLTIIAWLISSGQFGTDLPFFKTPEAMVAAGVNFIVANAIAAISVAALVKGIVSAYDREKALTENLEQEQRELLTAKGKLESEINERKQIGAVLKESEKTYRSFIENAPMAMYTINIKGDFTYGNRKLMEITGYKKEDWQDKPFHPIVYPDDLNIVLEKIQKRLNGQGASDPYEIRIFHSSGDIMWVEITSESIFTKNDNGEQALIGMQSFVTDITEKKKTAGKLQRERETLSTIFESNPHGIVLINKKGKYLYVNPMFSNITGYTLQDVPVGKEWLQKAYPDPEYRRTVIDAWKKDSLQAGVGGDYCFKITCKDGQEKDIEFRTTYLEDKSISVLTDISYRKKAEDELRESESRLQAILDNTTAIIYQKDTKGRFTLINREFERTFNISKEDIIGKTDYDLMPKEMADKYRENDEKVLKLREPLTFEEKAMHEDGMHTAISVKFPMYDDHGKHSGICGISTDISKEKKLQKQIQQAHKMEAIGKLAGGIAHQFNNALYTITGNIGLLEMDFPGDKNVANYAKQMADSAQRMTQLTAQLLAYASGGRYQAMTVLLSDLVRETVPLFEHTIDSAIHVDADLSRDNLKVKTDLTQMQMVLSAVFTNASESMDGKGRIRVACQKVAIADDTVEDFPGFKPGNYACLTVTDDGKGMDAETRAQIFEPFFSTKFEGRGLGMAAAYGIVKGHDGLISVDSELDEGTTVKIYLPAVETPVKEGVKKSPRAQLVKGTGTILVIDDEEAVVTVSRAILERMGYRVLEARSGQEAIDVVETFDGDINLAMLDILMPGMSGETLYPLLMKARPDLKVLVFSGYSIEGPVQKILDAGAEDFIQKPFAMADLSEKLKKILGSEQ